MKYGASFKAGREHCQEYGGDLVQNINHNIKQKYIASELERVRSSMQTKLLWIGAEKEPVAFSRTWRWLNGQILNWFLFLKERNLMYYI